MLSASRAVLGSPCYFSYCGAAYLAEGCCAGLYFITLTLDSLRESNNKFTLKITRIFICSHNNTITYKTQITSDMDVIV